MTLFDFLEQYLKRLEGPLALQVWPRYLQLAKDLAALLRDFKVQAFPALRYVENLVKHVSFPDVPFADASRCWPIKCPKRLPWKTSACAKNYKYGIPHSQTLYDSRVSRKHMESCLITAYCLAAHMSKVLGFAVPVVKSWHLTVVIPHPHVVSRMISLTFGFCAYFDVAVADLAADEKANASSISLPEPSKSSYEPDLVEQVGDISAYMHQS